MKWYIEEKHTGILDNFCSNFVREARKYIDPEVHAFVDGINSALAPSIKVFQKPFYDIFQALKQHVLKQNNYHSEFDIKIENYNTTKDWLGHWSFVYDAVKLGTTTVTIKSKGQIGKIETENIKFNLSFGDELSIKTNRGKYKIVAFSDYSGVTVNFNGYEYTNSQTNAFGSGNFSDCRSNELFFSIPYRNEKGSMFDEYFQFHNFRISYFDNKEWVIPLYTNKRKLADSIARYSGMPFSLSWRSVMKKIHSYIKEEYDIDISHTQE
jgi:hypothetical protein